MTTLPPNRFAELLEPYLSAAPVPADLIPKLSIYLDLLLKWNSRTNLTAIREPEEIVRRHFGEGLFLGLQLPKDARTLLDFGSGAGFPGLPIQLLRPSLQVTLAESQNKKAAFLREAVRSLDLAVEVWAKRVETMPAGRSFDVVALRAVDRMETATLAAQARVVSGGVLAVFVTGDAEGIPVPGSRTSVIRLSYC